MSQTKLEEIIVLFKKRHIELNPPATMEAVRKIEAQYRITLPQEYVSFITTVGNGGILPDSSGQRHLWQPAIPAQDFDPAMYVHQVFGMFGADIQRIKLLCENSAMRSVVDRFGEEVQTEVVDEEHFQATVDVAPSPPFFAWVFTFGGKIHIIEPEEVATKMGEMAGWL